MSADILVPLIPIILITVSVVIFLFVLILPVIRRRQKTGQTALETRLPYRKVQKIISSAPELEFGVTDSFGLKVVGCRTPDFTGIITVPEGVEEIGGNAFRECCMNTVRLPESLRRIDSGAFAKSQIRNIRLSGNVFVEKDAFFLCMSLIVVEMPFTAAVRQGAFTGCTGLKRVIIDGYGFELKSSGDLGSEQTWRAALLIASEGRGKVSERSFKAASGFTEEHCGEMLCKFTESGEQELVCRLTELETLRLPPEAVDKAIETAVEQGHHGIYVMLVQYKRDKFGFDGDGEAGSVAGERFEL